MAKYNKAISITFNNNDGGVGWAYYPESASDIHRHWRIFGKYRTRWILFKRFWRALILLEESTETFYSKPEKLWVFNAEIPE